MSSAIELGSPKTYPPTIQVRPSLGHKSARCSLAVSFVLCEAGCNIDWHYSCFCKLGTKLHVISPTIPRDFNEGSVSLHDIHCKYLSATSYFFVCLFADKKKTRILVVSRRERKMERNKTSLFFCGKHYTPIGN